MITGLYQMLAAIGYHHPLHPPVTHLTVGLMAGAFIFLCAARLFDHQELDRTAHHCIELALLTLPVTLLLGLLDWLYFYGGTWLAPIRMKMLLAGLLVVFLLWAWRQNGKKSRLLKRQLPIYGACLLLVGTLGFLGGELVYGSKTQASIADDTRAQPGEILFSQSCAMCHFTDSRETKIGPGLQGLFKNEQLPVSKNPVSATSVAGLLKHPYKDMPSFPNLTEEEVQALIVYLQSL